MPVPQGTPAQGDTMGAFEHVLSLLSFVYALAIAHLLTTVARLIGARERVRFSWFHAYWMLNALIVLVIDWISYWDMHALPNWTMASVGIVLVQAFVDYLQAALVCPDVPAEGTIDLAEFHRTHAGRYIGAFTVVGIVALCDNLYFGTGYNISEVLMQNIVVVPMIAVAATATFVRRRWVDIAAPILMLCVWSYYLTQLQGALK
jgi:hypothetical protein